MCDKSLALAMDGTGPPLNQGEVMSQAQFLPILWLPSCEKEGKKGRVRGRLELQAALNNRDRWFSQSSEFLSCLFFLSYSALINVRPSWLAWHKVLTSTSQRSAQAARFIAKSLELFCSLHSLGNSEKSWFRARSTQANHCCSGALISGN